MLLVADRNPTSVGKGLTVELMTEESADEAISTVVCPSRGISNHTLTLIAHADVAGVGLTGALQPETSDDPLAPGGWSPFGGGPIDVSTITIPAGETEGRLELSFSQIAITALRGRITTVIGGGSLSFRYTGL